MRPILPRNVPMGGRPRASTSSPTDPSKAKHLPKRAFSTFLARSLSPPSRRPLSFTQLFHEMLEAESSLAKVFETPQSFVQRNLTWCVVSCIIAESFLHLSVPASARIFLFSVFFVFFSAIHATFEMDLLLFVDWVHDSLRHRRGLADSHQ